jgi:hypothetical protein
MAEIKGKVVTATEQEESPRHRDRPTLGQPGCPEMNRTRMIDSDPETNR